MYLVLGSNYGYGARYRCPRSASVRRMRGKCGITRFGKGIVDVLRHSNGERYTRLRADSAWIYLMVTVSAPAANDGAPSPLLIVRLVVSRSQINMFPAVDASYTPYDCTVPQFAVGEG